VKNQVKSILTAYAVKAEGI